MGDMKSGFARRSFLRVLGALVAAPVIGRAAAPDSVPAGRFEDDRESWLRVWSVMPRVPVCESGDPVTLALLDHARRGRQLAVFYHGGSRPGRLRRFSPELVFRVEGGRATYVSGFCQLRGEPRILRVDRIGLA